MNPALDWLLHARMTVGPIVREPLVLTGPPIYFLTLAGTWIGSWVWIASDARKRGKSPFWAVFFLFFAWWPVSLLWWRWLRPPLLSPPPEGQAFGRWEWVLLVAIIVTALATLYIATSL